MYLIEFDICDVNRDDVRYLNDVLRGVVDFNINLVKDNTRGFKDFLYNLMCFYYMFFSVLEDVGFGLVEYEGRKLIDYIVENIKLVVIDNRVVRFTFEKEVNDLVEDIDNGFITLSLKGKKFLGYNLFKKIKDFFYIYKRIGGFL